MKKKDKNKKIKQLDIVFENCEVFTLTPDMINICYVSGIKNDVGINCFQYENGEVYENTSCEEMLLIINSKGLEQTSSFGFDNCILGDRLKLNDITHIDIIYDDKTNLYISVPWEDKDGNEYYNILQYNISTQICNNNAIAVIVDRYKLPLKKIKEKYGI